MSHPQQQPQQGHPQMHHRNSISLQQQQALVSQQAQQQKQMHMAAMAQGGVAHPRYPMHHIQTSLPNNMPGNIPSAPSPQHPHFHPYQYPSQHQAAMHHAQQQQAAIHAQQQAHQQQQAAIHAQQQAHQQQKQLEQQKQAEVAAAAAAQQQQQQQKQQQIQQQRQPSAGPSSAPISASVANVPHSSLSRLSELFDNLRAEIETLAKEASVYKAQKDELEARLSQQLHEMQAFQQTIFEFEKAHVRMKTTYEEEIIRLRRELEIRNIPIPTGSSSATVPSGTGSSPVTQFPGLNRNYPQKSPVETQSFRPLPVPHHGQQGPSTASNSATIASKPPTPSLAHIPLGHQNSQQSSQMQQQAPQQQIQHSAPHGYAPHQGYPTYQQPQSHTAPPTAGSQVVPRAQADIGKRPDSGIPIQRMPSGPPPAAVATQAQPSAIPPTVRTTTPIPGHEQLPPKISNVPSAPAQVAAPQPPSSTPAPIVAPNPTGLRVGVDNVSLDEEKKRSGKDWSVIYNPKHPASKSSNHFGLSLMHSFDHESVIWCVKFSPDGKYLATGSNHIARIYDTVSGSLLCELVDASVTSEDLYIRSICFSPDGKKIATGSADVSVRIWDIETKTISLKLAGHEQEIYSVDWSMDGKMIASGSADLTCRIWDPNTGKCLHILHEKDSSSPADPNSAGEAGIASVAIRPKDGKCVAAGYFDKAIRIWDVATGQLLQRFEGHTNLVFSVAFSPDGNSIVSGSLDCHIHVWDLSKSVIQYLDYVRQGVTGEKAIPPRTITTHSWRHAFLGHEKYVLSVAYPGLKSQLGAINENGERVDSPGIDWIISGSKDHTITFWDTRCADPASPDAAPVLTLRGHDSSVISIAFSLFGGLFATGSGDMKARLWRMTLGSKESPIAVPNPVPATTTQETSSLPSTAAPSIAMVSSIPMIPTSSAGVAPTLSMPIVSAIPSTQATTESIEIPSDEPLAIDPQYLPPPPTTSAPSSQPSDSQTTSLPEGSVAPELTNKPGIELEEGEQLEEEEEVATNDQRHNNTQIHAPLQKEVVEEEEEVIEDGGIVLPNNSAGATPPSHA